MALTSEWATHKAYRESGGSFEAPIGVNFCAWVIIVSSSNAPKVCAIPNALCSR